MPSVSEARRASTDIASVGTSTQAAAPLGRRVGKSKTAVPWPHNVLLYLVAFRLLNALTIRTFFQPDEYFQSLEPAWQMAFGAGSGAWITWEWRNRLRSAIHPGLFAGIYYGVSAVADVCNVQSGLRAELLLAAPKIAQAVLAAVLDFANWKLAERIFGQGSSNAWATLALTVCSPWQWFCSTRTLSNCLETTITAAALYYWPWQCVYPRQQDGGNDAHIPVNKSLKKLRLSLLLAALACVLRPTNLLIWLCISIPTLWRTQALQRRLLIREALICGTCVLAFSALCDRLYYRTWTLPQLHFLHFNLAQDLAVFYGQNRRDYYLTEGLPLLLTTASPFALSGLSRALLGQPNHSSKSHDPERPPRPVLRILAWTVETVILVLSLISHKEVRFIYPLLPLLHLLSAGPLVSFLTPLTASRKAALALLLALNLLIAGYATQVHQRGVIDVLHYLRHEHEQRPQERMNVGFLMPCHSTPWRSHLVYPEIEAWALTCEPPVGVPRAEREGYVDEADKFYLDPKAWIEMNLDGARDGGLGDLGGRQGKGWPEYLVFFAQLEDTIREATKNKNYVESWRGFNSHWHDDWRRRGDVVVYKKIRDAGAGR